MVKKIVLITLGVAIAVMTYGFIQHSNSESNEPVEFVKARKALDWTAGRNMTVVPPMRDDKISELTWHMLTDVAYSQMYVPELDMYYWKPKFGPSVKSMEGKEVYITGYVIPVDYDENFYVVSRYPYANCYFCGGGGPESVCDLRFKGSNRQYKTDERLTFKGKLKLNATDVYQMNYILEDAVEFQP